MTCTYEKFTNSTDVVKPNIGSIEKALLCVGFIIEAEPSKKRKTLTMVGERKITVSNKNYWKKVKKELQDLENCSDAIIGDNHKEDIGGF